jgi:Uma2 family endonuclease
MPQPAIEEVDQRMLPLTEEEMKEFEAAVAELITEDDTPVDNPFSEKQQRLLAETLYTGWTPPPNEEYPQGGRTFWGAANVGLFPVVKNPAIVPHVFLSLDVAPPENWHKTKSYFFWEFGKAPDVVIEIVSNTKGGELSGKKYDYARLKVTYYVVFDPQDLLKEGVLQVFVLHRGKFKKLKSAYLPEVGLGLTLWHGEYEKKEDTYLRWCDQEGNLLPTGKELAAQEAERAEREAERAQRETERAQREAERADQETEARRQAEARAAQMAAKLRELGLDPDQI